MSDNEPAQAPELKPCPFCGSEAEFPRVNESYIKQHFPRGQRLWIKCVGCRLTLQDTSSIIFEGMNDAAEFWNLRRG